MAEPTRIGELVGGKYRISRLLARGGMGVVYEAQHEIVKRRFAVKFLRPDYAHRREFLERFQREAEAAGALENEHIASALDFGVTADGSPFIVMEYLVGENLASLLEREQRLPLERAADLCVQACHGAEAAHAAGILHRDLKPKNLFVVRREDGTDLLKILDFGVAKLAPLHHDHTTTETGAVIGTPAYMSPEQARGERTLDLRSDVYALGTILFEMLSGQLPHPGDSPNAILHHISTRPAVSLAVAAPGLPGTVVEMVDRALATDPGARPQSASELAQGLASFAQRKVWSKRRGQEPTATDSTERAKSWAASQQDRGIASRTGPSRRSGGKRVVMLLVAGALVVAVVSIAARLRKPASSSADGAPPTSEVAKSAPTVPPAAAAPMPTPSLGAAPATPTSVDAASGRTMTRSPRKHIRPVANARERSSGLPSGLPSGHSDERPPAASSPDTRVEIAPRPGKPAMPRAVFDPANPYAAP